MKDTYVVNAPCPLCGHKLCGTYGFPPQKEARIHIAISHAPIAPEDQERVWAWHDALPE